MKNLFQEGWQKGFAGVAPTGNTSVRNMTVQKFDVCNTRLTGKKPSPQWLGRPTLGS